jgi:hypothetical protein
MSDDPAYSKIDLAIAIGLAVLIAIWLVLYAVVALRPFLN